MPAMNTQIVPSVRTGPPCDICGGRGSIPDRLHPTKLAPCPFCRGAGTTAWRAREATKAADRQLFRKLFRAAHWVAIFVFLALIVRAPTGVPPVWEMLAWMGLVVLKPSLWVARMEAEARQERGTRI